MDQDFWPAFEPHESRAVKLELLICGTGCSVIYKNMIINGVIGQFWMKLCKM